MAAMVVVGLGSVLVLALNAGAGRTPSRKAVIVCASSVTYTDPHDAPAVAVYPGSGGGTDFIACPVGGGKFRVKVPLLALTTDVRVACWKRIHPAGRSDRHLRFRGDCGDTTGSYGTFATFTVR